MTGKVHVLFDNLPGSVEFVKTGKLRALGVTTAKRNRSAARRADGRRHGAGLRGERVLRRRRAEGHAAAHRRDPQQGFNAALADPKIKERIAQLGAVPTPMTPAEFGKLPPTRPRNGPRWCKAANISVE